MKKLIRSLRIYLVFTIMLGLAYPLAITFISRVLMPYKANGSFLRKGSKVVGSKLIGQSFTGPEYFHARFSANNYNGTSSGGTNLGPSSKKLMDSTADRIAKVRQENGLNPAIRIPADMVLASASGLDPHITFENAMLQAVRVSRTRGIPIIALKGLVHKNTDPDFIGIWGQPGVNVLALNIELDESSEPK
jgi:potassium-transporting ATPase KdpC subunit